MGLKGQHAWNKTPLDEAELVRRYQESKTAVREIAEENSVSVQAIYGRLRTLRIARRSNSQAHEALQVGPRNSNWKGGRFKSSHGYVRSRLSGKEQYEHRAVAEGILGHPLRPGEVIHHRNGERADNGRENLEIFPSHAEHMRQRHMTSAEARRRAALKAVNP